MASLRDFEHALRVCSARRRAATATLRHSTGPLRCAALAIFEIPHNSAKCANSQCAPVQSARGRAFRAHTRTDAVSGPHPGPLGLSIGVFERVEFYFGRGGRQSRHLSRFPLSILGGALGVLFEPFELREVFERHAGRQREAGGR